MRPVFLTILVIISSTLVGQSNLGRKVLINGSSTFDGAFLFFPLLNDSIQINGTRHLQLDTTNPKRKLFYCVFNNEKSKIYNLDSDLITTTKIDFKIPDKDFFDKLYKMNTCPLCHKSDQVVPFIYGKPSDKLIQLADKGKVKLAGCSLSNTSPKLYCKTDSLEF